MLCRSCGQPAEAYWPTRLRLENGTGDRVGTAVEDSKPPRSLCCGAGLADPSGRTLTNEEIARLSEETKPCDD